MEQIILMQKIENLQNNCLTAMEKTIKKKTVTYDFARLIDDPIEVSCSDFGEHLIKKF